jgi:hypothetical protein
MNTQLIAINIFCVYCGLAVAFTYLYYVTIFIAIMAIFADFEADARHSLIVTSFTIPCEKAGKLIINTQYISTECHISSTLQKLAFNDFFKWVAMN